MADVREGDGRLELWSFFWWSSSWTCSGVRLVRPVMAGLAWRRSLAMRHASFGWYVGKKGDYMYIKTDKNVRLTEFAVLDDVDELT